MIDRDDSPYYPTARLFRHRAWRLAISLSSASPLGCEVSHDNAGSSIKQSVDLQKERMKWLICSYAINNGLNRTHRVVLQLSHLLCQTEMSGQQLDT